MFQRLGRVIYWTASGVALLFVLGFFIGIRGELVSFVEFLVAGLFWLAGEAVRHVLAG
jgi:hypothetical protein